MIFACYFILFRYKLCVLKPIKFLIFPLPSLSCL